MSVLIRLFLVLSIAKCIRSLIVPEEVPSLLSLVYSNIPPIKKGTDSRLGWGFRLGDHADWQVIVELGPQTNTRPLGNEKKNDDNNSKRNVPNNLRNVLYAQNQLLKKQELQKRESPEEPQADTPGARWLRTWSQAVNAARQPQEGAGEIDARLVIPPELEELYGKPGSPKVTTKGTTQPPVTTKVTTQPPVTTTGVPTTTDVKDALDNVDLE